MRLELDGCRAYSFLDTEEAEYMDYASSGKSIFPDDDSNQILPVEQFFGNLDTVQVRSFGQLPYFGQNLTAGTLCKRWLLSQNKP